MKSIQYLFQYVYKGHDCTHVHITDHNNRINEIKKHFDSRYVIATEAMWRILRYMRRKSHVIAKFPEEKPFYIILID